VFAGEATPVLVKTVLDWLEQQWTPGKS